MNKRFQKMEGPRTLEKRKEERGRIGNEPRCHGSEGKREFQEENRDK